MTILVAGAGLLGMLAVALLSWRRAIVPIERPNPSSFPASLVAKGEVLAAEGHCVSCHTRPDGPPYAGGYGVNTPFGVIYGSNLTPDPKTGIGRWSLAAFTRAMREGVSRDGSHLFPAFPYYAYTELSDGDVQALYAYLMTRRPVSVTVPPNTLPFPLSVRFFQEGWKLLFFRNRRYQVNPSKSAEWNRGAYLSEALSDCGGCHTPRNPLGGEEMRHVYAGTVVDGWIAPALTDANPSPLPWTEDALFRYLRTGVSPLHGAATAATMTPVIRDGLALPVVSDSDVRAIALYFSDVDRARDRATDLGAMMRKAVEASSPRREEMYDPDANLYNSACLSCHANAAPGPLPARPELALNSALTLAEPANFIEPVLRGIGNRDGAPGLVMPAYAASLSDAEVARLAAYLRRTRTTLPPWTNLEKKVSGARRDLPHD
jgi:mono/diheme cytochrome c family protein